MQSPSGQLVVARSTGPSIVTQDLCELRSKDPDVSLVHLKDMGEGRAPNVNHKNHGLAPTLPTKSAGDSV